MRCLQKLLSAVLILGGVLQAASAQSTGLCASVVHQQMSFDHELQVSLKSLGLEGELRIYFPQNVSRTALRTEILDSDSTRISSHVDSQEAPQVLHVLQTKHRDGLMAMVPVIEVYMERNFVAAQLRDFAQEQRQVLIAQRDGHGGITLQCPELPWSPTDFVATHSMTIGINGAIAEFLAFNRQNTHQLNLENATLGVALEELQRDHQESQERLSELEDENNSLRSQLAALTIERELYQQRQNQVLELEQRGRRKMKRLTRTGSFERLRGAFAKFLKRLTRLIE